MDIVKIPLTPTALEYMRFVFSCDDDISERVMHYIADHAGDFHTYLPHNTPEKEIYEFRYGGKIMVPTETHMVDGARWVAIPDLAYEPLFQEIQDFLNEDTRNICFMRGGWWEKSDAWVQRENSRPR